MSELIKILFPYLVILYLSDGITFVDTYHLLFVSHFGKRFKMIKSGAYFFNISPLSYIIATYNVPLWVTRSGIYSPRTEQHYENVLHYVEDFQYITYDSIGRLEVSGKKVRINGETILELPSAVGAEYIVNLIRGLRDSSHLERPEKIKTILTKATNFREFKARKKTHTQHLLYLKLLSSLLFVNVFFVLPAVSYVADLYTYLNFFSLLFVIALIYLWTLIISFSLRRKIYHTNIGKIITDTLFAILSPVTVIQFPGHITKDMYVQFDYLTIAAALLPPDEFQDLMRRELYRIDHVKCQKDDAEWIEFWRLRTESLHTLLAQSGIALSEIFVAPKKQDKSSASYCPICLSEYRAGFEHCKDCSVALKTFEK